MEREKVTGADITNMAQQEAARNARVNRSSLARKPLMKDVKDLEVPQIEEKTSVEEEKPKNKNIFQKANDVVDKIKENQEAKKNSYVDPYNQKQEVDYRQQTTPTVNQQNMADTIGQTEDLIQRGAEEGEKANKALQNVEVPRSKLVSYNDIMKSDEFKGQRLPYMANAIGTNLANLLTGKDYQSYLKQQNQAMSDTYAQNKAARDTAATQANIQDIEAGNKAEMGKYVQMSDAEVEQALKRYGLLEDQETKKQVLDELISQATGKTGNDAQWKKLNAEEKFAVMALQQVYNGDYSVASMFLEKYGDDIAQIIDGLFEKLGITKKGNPNPANGGEEDYIFNIGNMQYTGSELTDSWASSPETIMAQLSSIVDENGEPDFAAQQDVINDLNKNWKKKISGSTKITALDPIGMLQRDLNQRKAEYEGQKQVDAEQEEARTAWFNDWKTNLSDLRERVADRNNSYKTRIDEIKGFKDQFENDLRTRGYVATKDMNDMITELETMKTNMEKAFKSKSFDNTAKAILTLNKKKGETDKDVLTRIANYEPNENNLYLKYTDGAGNIIDYLKDIRDTISASPAVYTTYNSAIDNAKKLFSLSSDEMAKYGLSKLYPKY